MAAVESVVLLVVVGMDDSMQMVGWMNGWIDRWMYASVHGSMHGQMSTIPQTNSKCHNVVTLIVSGRIAAFKQKA